MKLRCNRFRPKSVEYAIQLRMFRYDQNFPPLPGTPIVARQPVAPLPPVPVWPAEGLRANPDEPDPNPVETLTPENS